MNAISTTAVVNSSASGMPTATAGQTGNLDAVATKDAFLKLLVAQIRNQNPLDPTDGAEFLAQLAQFSQVEQLVEIRLLLAELAGQSEAAQKNLTPTEGSSVQPTH